MELIQLTNAVVPFDDDPIWILEPERIVDITIDHTLANADCTRITLDTGEVFQVQESIETVVSLIEQDKQQNKGEVN